MGTLRASAAIVSCRGLCSRRLEHAVRPSFKPRISEMKGCDCTGHAVEAFRALFSELFLPVLSAQEGWGRATQQHTAEFLQVLYTYTTSLLPSVLLKHGCQPHPTYYAQRMLRSGDIYICQLALEMISSLHSKFSVLHGICQSGTLRGVCICADLPEESLS